jgi:transposase
VWINGPWPDLRPGRKEVLDVEVLDVEDWAEIRRLHYADGLSIREISRRVGWPANTVRSAVRSVGLPVFDRKPRPSAVDAVEPEIRELLAEFPRMPATVIAERIGWDRSLTILKDRVRELRPLFVPADPCQRTEYRPGEFAQWDLWFPAVRIPLGRGQEAGAFGDRRGLGLLARAVEVPVLEVSEALVLKELRSHAVPRADPM